MPLSSGKKRFRGNAARPREMYKEFDATELFCPNCRRAVQVRKRLLLVLPDGDKYEYLCIHCGGSVGHKIDRSPGPVTGIV